MAEWVTANSGWLGLLLAVVLVPVTIALTIKYGPAKRPRYVYMQQRLVTRTHPALKIEFHGTEIDNLYVVRFCFWNAGRLELRDSDIPSAGGPKVALPESARLLSFTAEESHPPTGATLKPNPMPEIEFEYLNHGDGLQVELLYTLQDSDVRPAFAIKGALKGARKLEGWRWDGVEFGTAVGAIVMALLLAGSLAASYRWLEEGNYWKATGFGALGVFSLWASWALATIYVRSWVPAWVSRFLAQR